MADIAEIETATVASLFSIVPETPQALEAQLRDEDLKPLQTAIAGLPVTWGAMRTEIATVVASTLQQNVLGGMISAWRTYGEITEAAKKSKQDGSEELCRCSSTPSRPGSSLTSTSMWVQARCNTLRLQSSCTPSSLE